MKLLFKLLFAILSARILKDREQITLNRIEARYQLEKLLVRK